MKSSNFNHYGAGVYNLIDTKTKEKYRLTVEYDECCDSPREVWDNQATIWCWHDNYKIGDNVGNLDPSEALNYLCKNYTDKTEEEIEEASPNTKMIWLQESDKIVILPIFCYEHSGITISTSHSYPYNDRWDSSYIGFAFITKKNIFDNLGGIPIYNENNELVQEEHIHEDGSITYSTKYIPLSKENWRKRGIMCINDEVEILDYYLRGEVYGYKLEKLNHIIEEKTCPHCGEVISKKEFDEYEEIDSCRGFYGDTLENNGILNELPCDLDFDE